MILLLAFVVYNLVEGYCNRTGQAQRPFFPGPILLCKLGDSTPDSFVSVGNLRMVPSLLAREKKKNRCAPVGQSIFPRLITVKVTLCVEIWSCQSEFDQTSSLRRTTVSNSFHQLTRTCRTPTLTEKTIEL